MEPLQVVKSDYDVQLEEKEQLARVVMMTLEHSSPAVECLIKANHCFDDVVSVPARHDCHSGGDIFELTEHAKCDASNNSCFCLSADRLPVNHIWNSSYEA